MFSINRKLQALFSNDMGIDLGTANTVVWLRNRDEPEMSEPSVVAINKKNRQVMLNGEAVGLRAKQMLGKVMGNYEVVRPLQSGAICNAEIATTMLRYFIQKVHRGRKYGISPRLIIAVPSGTNDIEKDAVINSGEHAGARKVYLIDQPLASAIGAGLPVDRPIGSMICDIGGGTTEIAIISLAEMVVNHSIRVGGDVLDRSIIAYIKDAHGLLIGDNTAEVIKISIGSAIPLAEEKEVAVRGLHVSTSLPTEITVRSEEIREALSEPVQSICQAILKTLEQAPPELAADLVETGLTIAGGSSQLRGIDEMMSKQTGLPVKRAKDPMICVARGTGIALNQLDVLKDALYSGSDKG